MLPKPSLSEVKKELQAWRNSKNRGKWVPTEIKQKIVQLLSEHKVSEVITKLNISSSTIHKWKHQYSVTSEHYQESSVFVALPPEKQHNDRDSVKNLLFKITKQATSGNCWTIEANLNTKEWKTAINLMESLK